MFRPPEVNEEWRTQGAWYHIDQNLYNRSGLHAVQVSPPPYLYLSLSQVVLYLISFYYKIQGLVNFFPSGPYDGGFVVAPKSHLMNEEAFASIQKKTEEREQMGEVYNYFLNNKGISDLCSTKSGDYFRTPEDLSYWVEARDAIKKRNETNRYSPFSPLLTPLLFLSLSLSLTTLQI